MKNVEPTQTRLHQEAAERVPSHLYQILRVLCVPISRDVELGFCYGSFYPPCATVVQTTGWSPNTLDCALNCGREAKTAHLATLPRLSLHLVERQAGAQKGKKEQWSELLGPWKM